MRQGWDGIGVVVVDMLARSGKEWNGVVLVWRETGKEERDKMIKEERRDVVEMEVMKKREESNLREGNMGKER